MRGYDEHVKQCGKGTPFGSRLGVQSAVEMHGVEFTSRMGVEEWKRVKYAVEREYRTLNSYYSEFLLQRPRSQPEPTTESCSIILPYYNK